MQLRHSTEQAPGLHLQSALRALAAVPGEPKLVRTLAKKSAK